MTDLTRGMDRWDLQALVEKPARLDHLQEIIRICDDAPSVHNLSLDDTRSVILEMYIALANIRKLAEAAQAAAPALAEALETAGRELAALVVDPERPDFRTVTDNEADVECLQKAYSTIRAALSAAKGE